MKKGLLFLTIVTVVGVGGFLATGQKPAIITIAGIPLPYSTEQTLSFITVGDSMLGRHVERLSANDNNYPFKYIGDLLKSTDFVVANLEGPIPKTQTVTGDLVFSFPNYTPKILSQNNIKIVSLANNHGLDQEQKGLDETRAALKKEDILFGGSPATINEESIVYYPSKLSPKSIFFFFNATWTSSFSLQEAQNLIETYTKPNVPAFVEIHWGEEYEPTANLTQKSIAYALLDAGATAVFGHHPHVTQEIETYKGKYIFYSLGNFIFDQYFSEEVQTEMAVLVTIEKEKIHYQIIPIQSELSQPRIMDLTNQNIFLKKLATKSSVDIQEAIAQNNLVQLR